MISYPDKIYFFLAGKPNGGLKLFIRMIAITGSFCRISKISSVFNHLEMETHTLPEMKIILP